MMETKEAIEILSGRKAATNEEHFDAMQTAIDALHRQLSYENRIQFVRYKKPDGQIISTYLDIATTTLFLSSMTEEFARGMLGWERIEE